MPANSSYVGCGFFQVILFCQFHLSKLLVLGRRMAGESAAQMNRISCLAAIPMKRQCQTGSSAPGISEVGGQVGISFISAKSTALCPPRCSLPAPKNLICVWKPATEAPWPRVSGLSQPAENTRIQVPIFWDPEMCTVLIPRAALRLGRFPRHFLRG